MKRCIYAGSFDPVTNGHLWMIREGTRIFDELIAAVTINPAKPCTFPLAERLEMLRTTVVEVPNVRVSVFSQQFLADYARSAAAQYILRGIRSQSDYEYERGIRYVTEDLNPELTTVFLIPPRSIIDVTSSMVKNLIGPVGWEHAIKKYVPVPVYSAVLTHELAKRFTRCWQSVSKREPHVVFSDIAARYSEPHRQYHTLAHIAHCLSELETLDLEPRTRNRVELAIWFHDVIYETMAPNNEARSALYFRQVAAGAQIEESVVDDVVALILATQKHEVPVDGNTEALRLLLDIDLAILGASPERFDEYDRNIRREYSSVPEAVYNLKRREVLEKFLSREAIYLTQGFSERYEQQARENLHRVVRSS